MTKRTEKKLEDKPNLMRRQVSTFRREAVDHVTASSNRWNLTLDFSQSCWTTDERAALDQVLGVVMPIGFAKEMLRCVQRQIERYEERFGIIPID